MSVTAVTYRMLGESEGIIRLQDGVRNSMRLPGASLGLPGMATAEKSSSQGYRKVEQQLYYHRRC